jgi:integrase
MFLVGIGLPAVRFHDLRASWATVLLSKGVEPIKVMKMGGWKDMKTMMIYTRKAGVDIRGATDCLNLHNPNVDPAEVLQFDRSSKS